MNKLECQVFYQSIFRVIAGSPIFIIQISTENKRKKKREKV